MSIPVRPLELGQWRSERGSNGDGCRRTERFATVRIVDYFVGQHGGSRVEAVQALLRLLRMLLARYQETGLVRVDAAGAAPTLQQLLRRLVFESEVAELLTDEELGVVLNLMQAPSEATKSGSSTERRRLRRDGHTLRTTRQRTRESRPGVRANDRDRG